MANSRFWWSDQAANYWKFCLTLGDVSWNLSLPIFFRVPVALSTAVVVAGGTNILNEAKKRDFFFIIPCFINDVSVLLIYDHIVVIEEFSQFKKSFLWHFQYFDRPFFIFSVSRWKKFFFALPCEITIYSLKKNWLQKTFIDTITLLLNWSHSSKKRMYKVGKIYTLNLSANQ